MNLRFWLGLLLALGPVGTVEAFNQSGNWTVASGQGVFEYYLHGPKDSRIELTCAPDDPWANTPKYIAEVGFTINGTSSPDGLVTLMVDGRKFLLRDQYGTGKESTPCPECSNLAEFWRAVRVSKTVVIRLADGRRVQFASAGGDKLLGRDLCQ
jgi:hypothetical protein